MLIFKGKSGKLLETEVSQFDKVENCISVAQSKAWCEGEVFEEWIQEILLPISREKIKILLLLDKCPSITKLKQGLNIQILFIPAGLIGQSTKNLRAYSKNYKLSQRSSLKMKERERERRELAIIRCLLAFDMITEDIVISSWSFAA